MIVKVIQHNNMSNSINYLYTKAANDSQNTGADYRYLTNQTADDFLENVKELIERREDKINKELTLNNQIKHLVLGFHPSDKQLFERHKDEIIQDLFKELGIDPENHLMNIFIHNDKSHPHIHVAFSRIGDNLEVFNDQKIGERVGEFAKKMNKKYGLYQSEEKAKIVISSKHLYKPTKRGSLIKLIDYAVKEAKDLSHFQKILNEHGVRSKRTPDGKIIYMTPNPDVINKEKIPELIEFAKKTAKSQHEYRQILQANGLFVKTSPDGKEVYSIKKVNAWTEDIMPRNTRLSQLYKEIQSKKHDELYYLKRDMLQKKIDSCETLGEIEKILPGSKLKYQISGDKIYNISIDHEDTVIKLHEVFTKDMEINATYSADYMKIPIIFTPNYFDKSEEHKQRRLSKKFGKKHRQIGFKVQI